MIVCVCFQFSDETNIFGKNILLLQSQKVVEVISRKLFLEESAGLEATSKSTHASPSDSEVFVVGLLSIRFENFCFFRSETDFVTNRN